MSEPSPEPQERTFLVVVDNSEELHVALRFASLRAKKTGGRVALLYVVEPAAFQHWMAGGDVMREGGGRGGGVGGGGGGGMCARGGGGCGWGGRGV